MIVIVITNTMIELPLIGISIALILAVVGAVFAYKCLTLWRRMNITGVCIEVTKDKAFLFNNFKYLLMIGGLAGFHTFLEMVEQLYSPPASFFWEIFYFVYYLGLVLLMLFLLVLAVVWYRVLSRVNRWDKRWIKANK